MNMKRNMLATIIMASLLAACNGDDGKDGKDGKDGQNGSAGGNGSSGKNGAAALVVHTELPVGHAQCTDGGIRVTSGTDTNENGKLDGDEVSNTSYVCQQNNQDYFERIATYPVCLQFDNSCDTDEETVAEISAASEDGMVVYYTDGEQEAFGAVSIENPEQPQGLGTFELQGEPTSISALGNYLLVATNLSKDDTQSGSLEIYNIMDTAKPMLERSIALAGQPDSVAVSKDGNYAAIVLENERLDEDTPFPQTEAGEVIVLKAMGGVDSWTTSTVALKGLADNHADDPEPEYVDINDNNIAVVTLQENNHIVLIDLETAKVTKHFSAGTVNLAAIDNKEEDRIQLTGSLSDVPREPDGVSWINNDFFATADEGDYKGGGRGFTVYNTQGKVVYQAANQLEHLAVRFGHYPEGRSENKGNEPENIEVGEFGDDNYLFVASERANLVFVYDVNDADTPKYKQTLPAAVGPEGILAIPSRDLVIASSEKDDRGDKMRAGLNIYRYGSKYNRYPSIQSVNDANGHPIPWSALSGLVAADDSKHLYAVEDSAYTHSRLFKIDASKQPAVLTAAMQIKDSNDVLKGLKVVAVDAAEDAKSDARKDVFDSADLAAMVNEDKTVNLDPEGIAMAANGGFWLVSEGSGTVGDKKKPVNSVNLLLKLNKDAEITRAHRLPEALENVQLRFGFEGVTESDGKVVIAMQRAWNDEETVRIAKFDPSNTSWKFFNYTLDEPKSQNGGWVGLSEITALKDGEFLVVERDNQSGPDAAIKKLYRISLKGLADGADVTKMMVRDLMPDLTRYNNLAFEKVEGLAVMPDGNVFIVNDNDGVDDNSGETQLLNLGKIL
ncbi:esterase-like activity of phytase family protein [Parashewanella tropica]|uniref:esterase-like activity of phytase family protein n=1 Tax=Parashewanella tropica TaxID=2547970 RepID=UPI001059947C|nr:esterase-like activity of phytase family protein [Parashewanella tropica]